MSDAGAGQDWAIEDISGLPLDPLEGREAKLSHRDLNGLKDPDVCWREEGRIWDLYKKNRYAEGGG